MNITQLQGRGSLALTLGVAGMLYACASARATVITFDSQTDSFQPFVSDSEAGFTVAPATSGEFFQAGAGTFTGSIYLEPSTSFTTATLDVTDGGASFDFISSQFASRSSGSGYFFEGFSGSTLEFTESGNLMAANSLITTSATSTDASTPITSLEIILKPGAKTTAINVDNITVAAVPEPMTTSLLGAGALALAAFSWRRRRA